MTPVLLSALANLGAGALLGWLALPLFARLTALRFVHEASSSHRALLWAFGLAALLMLVPWARALVAHRHGAGAGLSPLQPAPAPVAAAASSLSALGFHLLCAGGLAWLVAASLASALGLVSLGQLAAMMRRARPAPAMLEGAVALCSAPGVEKIRRLLVSDEASVPFVAVPWSPALVVPATFLDDFDDKALALMVEHEVAHLDRGDLWTSALVRALGVLFPFHPAAARLANDIAFAREASVDARVSPRDPHGYATLLLDVAANARFDQVPKPASLDDTALKRRIAMLTDPSTRRSPSIVPLVVCATVVALASLLAPPVVAAPPSARRGAAEEPGRAPPLPALRHTPESSYLACQGKEEGDACPFPTPDGDLEGRCRSNVANGRLFCEPPPPPGAPPPSERPATTGVKAP